MNIYEVMVNIGLLKFDRGVSLFFVNNTIIPPRTVTEDEIIEIERN
jgi:hypothetical protein